MIGIVFSFAADTVLIKKAYLKEPPKEYVPLTEEEIREFMRINQWKKEKFGEDIYMPFEGEINFTPYPSDTLIKDFEGISYTGWIPPDPQLAAGNTHVGVVVNTSISFFNKNTGIQDYNNTLRGFFSSVIPSGGMAFDPKIAYDVLSGRWLVLALYINTSTSQSHYLLAISQTDDPLGPWYYYRLDARYDDNTLRYNWADYPEIGFNDKWIVLTSQQIGFSSSDYYPKVRVLNKSDAYNGTLSSWEDFVRTELSCMYNWPRPSRSTFDYSSSIYLIRFNRMYKIYGPVNSPQLSPCITISLAPHSAPPNAPQGGGYQALEVVYATFQVYYMNGKIYYTFNEAHPLNSSLVSVRFIIIDTSGNVIRDERLYENGVSWIYPAVSVSPKGVAISFTRVGTFSGDYPSATYIGMAGYDTLFSPYRIYKPGTNWYFNDKGTGRNRWGDYFGGSADPVDSSLWVIAELPETGSYSTWTTWIANIDFLRNYTYIAEKKGDLRFNGGRIYTVDGRKVNGINGKGVYFVISEGSIRKVVSY